MFYKILAPVYHYVFPVEGKDVFLSQCFKPNARLLDIGCSDGRVAASLNQMNLGFKLSAIDLSEDLIEVAKEVNGEEVEIRHLNMLDLSSVYEAETFDGMYCIGNTLVHLENESEMHRAVKAMYQALKSEGVLVIQILNYALIMREKPKTLPLIENDFVRFERHYTYDRQRIIFSSKLVSGDQIQTATTVLFPILPDALIAILTDVGFVNIAKYSDFKFSSFDDNKLPLVIVAHKDLTNK